MTVSAEVSGTKGTLNEAFTCLERVYKINGHASPVERICVGKSGLYTIAGDCLLCCTSYNGNTGFGAVKTKTWQADLQLWEQSGVVLTCGAMCGTHIGVIKAWRLSNGEAARSMTSEGGPIRCLDAGPQSLASGSNGGSARIWDVEIGVTVSSSDSIGNGLRHVRYIQDSVIAAGDASGAVWLWDTRGSSVVAVNEHYKHPGGIQGLASSTWTRIFSIGRLISAQQDDDATLLERRARAARDVTEILEWDLRHPGEPARSVGFHAGACLGLHAVHDRLLASASKDGGCALWDLSATPCLAAEFRTDRPPTAMAVHSASKVVVVTSDRMARDYNASAAVRSSVRPILRPCSQCSGTGRAQTAVSTYVCMRCDGTGRFLFDTDAESTVDEQATESIIEDDTEEDKKEQPVEVDAKALQLPSWLQRWLPSDGEEIRPKKPFKLGDKPFAIAIQNRDRFEPGDLVVLASSIDGALTEPARERIFDRNDEPALLGKEVGIIVHDDYSKVPYEVRGPRSIKTSWFEAWELAACPTDREQNGKRALDEVARLRPPTPPTSSRYICRQERANSSQSTLESDYVATDLIDFRQTTTRAADPPAKTERDRALELSLAACHGQRCKRTSGRLQRLRETTSNA